jgi:hypothetical protein
MAPLGAKHLNWGIAKKYCPSPYKSFSLKVDKKLMLDNNPLGRCFIVALDLYIINAFRNKIG